MTKVTFGRCSDNGNKSKLVIWQYQQKNDEGITLPLKNQQQYQQERQLFDQLSFFSRSWWYGWYPQFPTYLNTSDNKKKRGAR